MDKLYISPFDNFLIGTHNKTLFMHDLVNNKNIDVRFKSCEVLGA